MSGSYASGYGSADAFHPVSATNEKYPETTRRPQKSGVSPWVKFGVPAAIVIILAAVLGGVFGSRAMNNNNRSVNTNGNSANDSSSSISSSSSVTSTSVSAVPISSSSSAAIASQTTTPSVAASTTTTTTTTTSTTTTTTTTTVAPAAATPVVNLATWDWSKDKSIGMCLGNWLILERWMYEDWFVGLVGPNAWDEWDFSQTLGPVAGAAALQDHYNSWITEDDIQLMFEQGINLLRIPTGFWAWIPTVAGEPYINAGQVQQVERVLGYAAARGMYIVIDLHGLPGSQNGEQTSGHNTTTPSWFDNATNQARSDTAVATIISWIENNPYRSAIAGFEVINEPRPYTTEQDQEIMDYYTRSYTAIQASSWPVTMFIADAYLGIPYWRDFAAARATSPPSLVMEDHPYPGNFPAQTDQSDILSQVCAAANKYLDYPVPIVITEWSLYTGVKSTSFEKTFYESQLTAWTWSAGAMYWSYKLIPSQLQLAAGLDYSQYSFVTVVQNSTGTVPAPSDFGIANTITLSNAEAFLGSLTGNCGTAPSNVSPYNDGSFQTLPWTVEQNSRSGSTGSAAAAASRLRRKVKRSFSA